MKLGKLCVFCVSHTSLGERSQFLKFEQNLIKQLKLNVDVFCLYFPSFWCVDPSFFISKIEYRLTYLRTTRSSLPTVVRPPVKPITAHPTPSGKSSKLIKYGDIDKCCFKVYVTCLHFKKAVLFIPVFINIFFRFFRLFYYLSFSVLLLPKKSRCLHTSLWVQRVLSGQHFHGLLLSMQSRMYCSHSCLVLAPIPYLPALKH